MKDYTIWEIYSIKIYVRKMIILEIIREKKVSKISIELPDSLGT